MIPSVFHATRVKIAVLSSMVFLGAFLLFGMEPLVGRILTPLLGGAAHVWLVCLMFYQAMLLAGYTYAHLFAGKLGSWHLVFLFTPLVVLPFDIQHLPDVGSPIAQLLLVLFMHVSLPFIVLSTTAVVAQVWLSESTLGKDYEPYPLYAASNAGSFIALFGYSFLIEPLMGVRLQSVSWTAVYFVYLILACMSWFMLFGGKSITWQESDRGKSVPAVVVARFVYLKWILLSALPSALLLAVTNLIMLEIGSFPLTWTIPLALYLVTFVLTFNRRGGTPGFLKRLWPEILMVALLYYFLGPTHWHNAFVVLVIFFLICMISHGTLYEIRPSPKRLTHFYLAVAFGGWLGGAAISLVAPLAFNGLYEYPLILLLFAPVLFWCLQCHFKEILPNFSMFGGLRVVLVVLVVIQLGRIMIFQNQDVRYQHRNFYGTYRVIDGQAATGTPGRIRAMVHGSTVHGAQWLDGHEHTEPISYYYRGGAISQALSAVPSPRNIAVIGLGAGSAAAFAGERDQVTFYEIDPDIEGVARRWFTYLGDSKAAKRVVVGDGRLALQADQWKHPPYDVILVDAFTGDGIPVHLMTEEALAVYMASLAEDGLVVFHVSNRYYELRPLLKGLSLRMDMGGAINIISDGAQHGQEKIDTHCIVLTRNRDKLKPLLEAGWVMLGADDLKPMEVWTDDYINILEPLWEKVKARYKDWNIGLVF